MKNKISKSSLIGKLIVKSVFMGFISLAVVSSCVNLCIKKADAALYELDSDKLMELSEIDANGNPECAEELHKFYLEYKQDVHNLVDIKSIEEKKEEVESEIEKYRDNEGTSVLTIEETEYFCKKIDDIYKDEAELNKLGEKLDADRLSILNKYAQNPQ